MTTQRWEIPDLEWRPPDCPFCDNETNVVDRDVVECEHCGITWHGDGSHGSVDDETATQCEAVDGRFLPGGRAHIAEKAEQARKLADEGFRSIFLHADANRCHRPAGHAPGHVDRHGNWFDDSTLATTEQINAVSQ